METQQEDPDPDLGIDSGLKNTYGTLEKDQEGVGIYRCSIRKVFGIWKLVKRAFGGDPKGSLNQFLSQRIQGSIGSKPSEKGSSNCSGPFRLAVFHFSCSEQVSPAR